MKRNDYVSVAGGWITSRDGERAVECEIVDDVDQQERGSRQRDRDRRLSVGASLPIASCGRAVVPETYSLALPADPGDAAVLLSPPPPFPA